MLHSCFPCASGIHDTVAPALGHCAVFAVLSHTDRLPDVLLIAGCLDETGLRTVFAQSVGNVLAGIYMRVPVTHDVVV